MSAMTRQATATFVPVSLDEMDKVIRRGFRAFSPKRGKTRYGEITYELTPDEEDPLCVIRVHTSIFDGNHEARGEGEDSIRITIINTRTDRPLVGKMARVHRTQNWKDNLRDRIEDAVEKFEEISEDRAKAKQVADARAEQDRLEKEAPEKVVDEKERQQTMLETLATSSSPNNYKFKDMLDRFKRYKTLLSPAQLAWVEREFKIVKNRPAPTAPAPLNTGDDPAAEYEARDSAAERAAYIKKLEYLTQSRLPPFLKDKFRNILDWARGNHPLSMNQREFVDRMYKGPPV